MSPTDHAGAPETLSHDEKDPIGFLTDNLGTNNRYVFDYEELIKIQRRA